MANIDPGNMFKKVADGAQGAVGAVAKGAQDAAGAVAKGAQSAAGAVADGAAAAANAAQGAVNAIQNQQIVTPEQVQELLNVAYGKAIDGIPNVSKPVEELAADYAKRHKTTQGAAKALINNQLAKCTTSGFLSGLTGILALPVTLASIPANIANVLYVQIRMVAALAKLGGYDVREDQVQTMVYVCLAGSAASDVLKEAGVQVGNKLALNAVKNIPGSVLTAINQKVGFRLATKFGETGIVNLGKLVPVAGALIGGGFDFATTRIIATTAYKQFIDSSDDTIDEDIIEGDDVFAADIVDIEDVADVADAEVVSESVHIEQLGEESGADD